MKAFITLLAVTLAFLFLFSSEAIADPGVGQWLDSNGNEVSRVDSRAEASYSFTTAVDSKLIRVSATSDLCFDTDTLLVAAGAARIQVYRAVDQNNAVTAAAIGPLTVVSDVSDCLVLVPATYWVDVTTGRAASETPLVTIRAR